MKYIIYTTIVFVLFACDLANNKPLPQKQFSIILENNNNNQEFYPIDIKQTSDNGYLILSEIVTTDENFPLVYLIKTNEKGEVAWEKISNSLVSPCYELISIGSEYGFVCMNKENLNARLVKADENLSEITVYSGIIYPVAAQKISTGIAILSYDSEDDQSTFSAFNEAGNTLLMPNMIFFEKGLPQILSHFTRRGRRKPFFIQESTNSLIFNGLTNFSHSLVFTNKSNGIQTGILNGVRYESMVASLMPLANNNFSCLIYDVAGNVRMSTQAAISTAEISSVSNITGNSMSEIELFTTIRQFKGNINGKNLVLVNGTSKNGQCFVSAYDENAGNFIGSLYFGSSTKTEMASLAITNDGGMIILAKNFVAGRFGRIMLIKLSKEQTDKLGGK